MNTKKNNSKLLKWFAGGGIFAALVSSLCCIGPLILGAIGIGGASSLLFLEEFRGYIIGLVVLLLGIGWFMNFKLEKKECAEDSNCADPKKRKLRRTGLGISSILALFFILSPFFLRSIPNAQNTGAVPTDGRVKTLYIKGMTCGGCEAGVRSALDRAGLRKEQILSVDHTSPNPEKSIGSAVIKIPESLECNVIAEIKKSPGYIAFWSFNDKDPCNLAPPKSSMKKKAKTNSIVKIAGKYYDRQMNKVCQDGCSAKSVDYDPKDIIPNGNAKVGQVTRCPTSGVVFKVKKNSPKI